MNETMSSPPSNKPQSYFWHPKAHPTEMLADPPRKIVSAEGVHIVDAEGVRLLDAVAGLWNVNLGYSAKPIKDAIAEQLDRMPSRRRCGWRGSIGSSPAAASAPNSSRCARAITAPILAATR